MTLSNNRLLALNTASNYVLMGIRILQGILITRWLYHYLGEDYYGFWSILWAFFTYMIVFNLGFGAASQKYTAERIFDTDIKKYNSVMSIIFSSYAAIALVISSVVIIASFYIAPMTGLADPEKIDTCRRALLIFGIGTAILFPLAMFSDILSGLKLIYMKNSVLFFVRISEALGVLVLIYLDMGFLGIVTFSVGINIFFNLLMIVLVHRQIRGFKLSLGFDMAVFRQIYNFSAFAYINSIGNLIIAKTDRFVLGAMINLGAVSDFQLGTRLSDISYVLSTQFQDNVVPFSANMIARGEHSGLSKVLLSGMRFGSFVSVGATALFFALAQPTIKCLFDVDNAKIICVCQLFCVSQFVSCTVRGVPAKYLLMSGRHKFIALTTLAEAAANLTLSIWLCSKIGLMGVVYGTLIPNVIISCLVIFPPAARELKFGFFETALIFIKPALVAIPVLLFCETAKALLGQAANNFINLTFIYLAAGSLYVLLSWFFVLTNTERKYLIDKIPFKMKRGKA